MRDSRRQEDVDGIATELGVSSADLDKAINVDFNASSKAFYDFTHVPVSTRPAHIFQIILQLTGQVLWSSQAQRFRPIRFWPNESINFVINLHMRGSFYGDI